MTTTACAITGIILLTGAAIAVIICTRLKDHNRRIW